jgi:hypothetical protein
MLIKTNRLLIRSFKADDWKDVFAYCSDPSVMHYIPMGVMNIFMPFLSVNGNKMKFFCSNLTISVRLYLVGNNTSI